MTRTVTIPLSIYRAMVALAIIALCIWGLRAAQIAYWSISTGGA